MILALLTCFCIPALDAGRCEHTRNKVVKCFDIANKFEYFQELAGNELDASGYRGHEELSIVRHSFTGALDEDLFNFTKGNRRLQFLRLNNLMIKNGGLTDVRSDAFASFCSYLTELDLSLNRLRSIPLSALQCGGHSRLITLNLSGNVIELLGGLDGLRQLQILDLSNNSLHLIKPNGFADAHLLKEVHLQQNYLRVLSEQAFDRFRLRRGVTLDLADNPLECDCSLRWLVVWYTQQVVPGSGIPPVDGDQPVCKSPGRLRGQPVRMLSPMDLICEPVIRRSMTAARHQATNVDVYEGDRVQLACAVFADPKPRVWWTFKDSVTIGKTLDDQMKGGRYSIANVKLDESGLNVSSTLTIDPIYTSDAGQLRCVAAFHPGAASAAVGQNETSELFQLRVRPRHYRVKASGLWIVAILMTCSLACLVAFVVYCWLRWSRPPPGQTDKSWQRTEVPLASSGKFVAPPLLDLGPPMYGPKHMDHLNEDDLQPQSNHMLDDFDISAYEEDYRPLVDDLRPPGRDSAEFATTPLLFHHQHPSSSRTVLPTSLGETEL